MRIAFLKSYLTGFLLNHPSWQFAQFWPNRIQSTTARTLGPVTAVADIDQAREAMRQLGITAIQWPATQPVNGSKLQSRPSAALVSEPPGTILGTAAFLVTQSLSYT